MAVLKYWDGAAWVAVSCGGGAEILQQPNEPVSPAENDLWIDTDETAQSSTSVWVTYAPTLTNVTLGNGAVVAAYRQEGKTVDYRGNFDVGSTTTFSAGYITVPVPVPAKAGVWFTGIARGFDASVSFNRYVAVAELNSTLNSGNLLFASTGNGGWSNVIPITWASGDGIMWFITYEAA